MNHALQPEARQVAMYPAEEVIKMLDSLRQEIRTMKLAAQIEKPVTLAELMRHLGCTRHTIYRQIEKGMPFHPGLSGRYFFLSEVDKYIRENKWKP